MYLDDILLPVNEDVFGSVHLFSEAVYISPHALFVCLDCLQSCIHGRCNTKHSNYSKIAETTFFVYLINHPPISQNPQLPVWHCAAGDCPSAAWGLHPAVVSLTKIPNPSQFLHPAAADIWTHLYQGILQRKMKWVRHSRGFLLIISLLSLQKKKEITEKNTATLKCSPGPSLSTWELSCRRMWETASLPQDQPDTHSQQVFWSRKAVVLMVVAMFALLLLRSRKEIYFFLHVEFHTLYEVQGHDHQNCKQRMFSYFFFQFAFVQFSLRKFYKGIKVLIALIHVLFLFNVHAAVWVSLLLRRV